MDDISLHNWMSLDLIHSYGGRDIGLIRNLVFLYLGLFTCLTIWRSVDNRTSLPAHKYGRGVLSGFIAHQGYALYLIAGACLIGIPFEQTPSDYQLLPILLWLAGFFFLISVESFRSPNYRYFDESVSFSRLIIFPVSFCVFVWIWTGAKWF